LEQMFAAQELSDVASKRFAKENVEELQKENQDLLNRVAELTTQLEPVVAQLALISQEEQRPLLDQLIEWFLAEGEESGAEPALDVTKLYASLARHGTSGGLAPWMQEDTVVPAGSATLEALTAWCAQCFYFGTEFGKLHPTATFALLLRSCDPSVPPEVAPIAEGEEGYDAEAVDRRLAPETALGLHTAVVTLGEMLAAATAAPAPSPAP